MPKRQPSLAGRNVRKRVSPHGVERYEARYTDEKGVERQRSFRTAEAALAFQVTRRADVVRGLARDEDKARRTFRDYATQWVADKATHARPVTVQGYAALLDRYALPILGDLKVGAITSATILDYLRALSAYRTASGHGLSPATIKHATIPVKAVLALALVDGAIHTNPVVGVRLPSRNAAPKDDPFTALPLSAQEIGALCAALDDRDPSGLDSLVVMFAANTGLRAAEIAGLEVRDYNALGRTIRVERTKTAGVTGEPKSRRSVRTIPVPPWLADALDGYLDAHPRRTEPSAPLFPARVATGGAGNRAASGSRHAPKGRTRAPAVFDWSAPLEPGTFLKRRLRPALEPAGLPSKVRLHDLRHSYGTNLRKAGRPLDEISRLMGHASLAVTHSLYVHDDPSRFVDTVAVLVDPRATSLHPAPSRLRKRG